MKYESLHGLSLPKIGFGTWNIGGGSRPQPRRDADYMRALLSALDLGYTHFDTAETYAAGHSEELLGRALRESRIDRGRVFLATKVAPGHLDYQGILEVVRSKPAPIVDRLRGSLSHPLAEPAYGSRTRLRGFESPRARGQGQTPWGQQFRPQAPARIRAPFRIADPHGSGPLQHCRIAPT